MKRKTDVLKALGAALLVTGLIASPAGALAVPGDPPSLPVDGTEMPAVSAVNDEGAVNDEAATSAADTEESLEAEAQIVGGRNTPIASAPWQVALLHTTSGDNYNGQFCGGSVITRQWVVTAAHCFVTRSGSTFVTRKPTEAKVLAGTAVLDSTGRTGRLDISMVVTHPRYDPVSKNHDIALVKLSKPLRFSSSIRPIALAKKRPAVGASARITGWGNTWVSDGQGHQYNPNGTPQWPQQLQIAELTVQSHGVCSDENRGRYNSASMLCAKTEGHTRDTCQGDSGGPLATRSGGRWYLSGVTSWGFGCAWESAGVYANVASYRTWVDRTIIEPARKARVSKVKKGRNAATVNITNYSKQFKYTVKKVSGTGKVVKGKARGSKLPIKVTKIKPGKWVKVKITTKRDGYKTSTKTIKIRR